MTENTGYVWTDGDIYEIVQTDQQEGAAIGASFGGLGVDNQPHQLLLNKVKLTHTKQLVDEGNIAALQAFEALFSGSMAQNGFLNVGVNDATRGLINYTAQWGLVDFGGSQPEGLYGPYSFPAPFVNACYLVLPVTMTDEAPGSSAQEDNVIMISSAYRPTKSQFYVWNNLIAGHNGARGFYYLAIGY